MNDMAGAKVAESSDIRNTEITFSPFIADSTGEPSVPKSSVKSNDVDSDGKTTRLEATSCGDDAAVLSPVENDKANTVESKGRSSPLLTAARDGDEVVVRLLIEQGADINAKDSSGRTVLHHAAKDGQEAIVQLLIERGADVNARDSNDNTILHEAARSKSEAIVQLLIERGADVNARNSDDDTALHKAIESNKEAIACLLVKEGADINAKTSSGETVLQEVVQKSMVASVQLLIERGADVNVRDSNGNTVLHKGVVGAYNPIFQLIIEQDADVNAKNNSGYTILHKAARSAYKNIVEVLVKKGADVHARDNDGNTVLHEAAKRNKDLGWLFFEEAGNIARLLVEKGADIEAKNSDDDTILHTAARNGNEAIVQLLIKKGADINVKNSRNNTALDEVAAGGSEAILRLLIGKGADTRARNDNNNLPLQLAVESQSSRTFPTLGKISEGTSLSHDEVGHQFYTALRLRDHMNVVHSDPPKVIRTTSELRAKRRRSRLEYLRGLKERMGLVPIQDDLAQFASHLTGNTSNGLANNSVGSTQLCDYCHRIPIMMLLKHSEREYTFPGGFAELQRSANSCVLCAMILASVQRYEQMSAREISLVVTPEFLLVEVLNEDPDTYGILRLCADSGSKAAHMGVHVGLPYGLSPESELYFLLLRSWIETCDTYHHDHGVDSKEEKKLPKRVLDLGDSKESEVLRLYVTHKQEKGKYIALSHCWGKEKFETLTKDTLEHFRREIDFHRLPQTFRDAVTVTRALGVRYLWIDSYCIIQKGDDMSDWKEESQRMEEYFSSAYCTIAATSAAGPNEGLFAPHLQPRSVSILDANNKAFEVFVSEIDENIAQDVDMGVLNTRAWVLQERALSRRTIHFTGGRTYWECESVVRCDNLLQMSNVENLLASSNFPSTAQHQSQSSFAYEQTFAMYSRLALTRMTDRPVAISGLAKRLGEYYRSNVTSGIVHRYLHQSLLWKRAHDERMHQIPELQDIPRDHDDSVPTWSWLLFRGEIRYDTQCLGSIQWERDLVIKLTPQKHLEAPVYSLGVSAIEHFEDTNCRLRDAERRLVGWARFDEEDADSPAGIACIKIGKHRYAKHGWATFGEEANAWKRFANVTWFEDMAPGDYCYVLLLRNSDRQQQQQYVRIGVGVVLAAYLKPIGGKSRIV